MHDALLDSLAVVVNPLDNNVTGRLVVRLAAAGAGVVDGEGGARDLEGEGGLESRLRLGVEVDAQLLQVGRGVELRVDAARGILEEGELIEVALGGLEELVCPGALKGGQLGRGEEAFQAVVEV